MPKSSFFFDSLSTCSRLLFFERPVIYDEGFVAIYYAVSSLELEAYSFRSVFGGFRIEEIKSIIADSYDHFFETVSIQILPEDRSYGVQLEGGKIGTLFEIFLRNEIFRETHLINLLDFQGVWLFPKEIQRRIIASDLDGGIFVKIYG